MGEIKEKREKMMKDVQLLQQLQKQYKDLVALPQDNQQKIAEYEKKLMDQSIFIQDILKENGKLREKVDYYEKKVKKLIDTRIREIKENKDGLFRP